MNNIPNTIYRCKKCSRVTTFYPLGCHEEECPIKRDWVNDTVAGIKVIGWVLAFCLLVFLSLVAQR